MMLDDNKHPECRTDEIFLSNADEFTFSMISYKTKRKGIISYDINGEEIGDQWPGSFPVFVNKEEFEKETL